MNKRDVIIACDFSSAADTLNFLDKFSTACVPEKPFVKIGMELFYSEGPERRSRDSPGQTEAARC